ncbi:MAG: hypothetical protein HKP21_00430 [Xanthomonadales bacterium]|nr:hypothetical protein [Gammaproteobacteria bacterium]NNK02991.1 hypothetical protein [Xanthomonadales bacterium]
MNPKALIRAAIIAIAWIAIATIGSELSVAFKQLLTSIGGHHWIGKSILTAVFFVLSYLALTKFSDDELSLKDTLSLVGMVILAGLAILIFYILHA